MLRQQKIEAASAGLEVLIVDDDELVCARSEKLLEACGIRAVSVQTLDMAREAMRAIYFPMVLLDRKLGEADALDLCREYRARQVDRKVLIVMYSALDSAAERKTALAAGADDFISKRASSEEFTSRITELYAIASGHKEAAHAAPPELQKRRLLSDYGVVDTVAEQAYDDIVRIAATICQTPIAFISLADDQRRWFKAQFGLTSDNAPREHAFSRHVMENPNEVFVVTDARADARFASNPLVTGEAQIRFYAGAPLLMRDGQVLGTLCVMDRLPRHLDLHAGEALRALARQVMLLLEQRKMRRDLEQALAARRVMEADVKRSEALFREAFERAPIGLALVALNGQWLRVNQSLCEMLGYCPEQLLKTSFQTITHPEDMAADLKQVAEMLAGTITGYQMKKRYRHHEGHYVHAVLSVSMIRDEAGNPSYFVSQIRQDQPA